MIFRRSAGDRFFGPIFLHNRIPRGNTRYTGLQALSPAPWQTAAAGISAALANLGGGSLSAPHDRVPHCTAASQEAVPIRSSWRPVAAADAGSAGPGADPDTCTEPGLNLGTWPAPSGVRAAGSVRLVAALPDGGACGVAAVCRRPEKGPPRQFGERAFSGLPWMPTWVMGLGWSSVGLCGDIREVYAQRPRRCRQQAKRSLAAHIVAVASCSSRQRGGDSFGPGCIERWILYQRGLQAQWAG